MLVRFTTKKHGPVAVANVDDAKVELSPDLLSFSARGRGKPLVFELRLRLEQRILPAASSWSFEVARTRTLALTLILTLTVTLTLTLPNPNPNPNQGRGQLRGGRLVKRGSRYGFSSELASRAIRAVD